MGNAHVHGHGMLLHIDRPLVPDLTPEEELVVEILVNEAAIRIDRWPSQAIVVPPPIHGVLRISCYAVREEEDGRIEARDIGHVLIPHEACEIFQTVA